MYRIFAIFSCLALVSAGKLHRCCGVGEVLINSECHMSSKAVPPANWTVFDSKGTANQIKPDQLIQNLIKCYEGFVIATTDFKAFENGSLKTPYTWEEDFCLNQDADGSLVAQYCSIEPCVDCVKKCCPSDSVFVTEDGSVRCGRTNLTYNWTIDLTAMYGAQPVCNYSKYALKPAEYSVAPNGSLLEHGDSESFAHNEYCIEHDFRGLNAEHPGDVIALVCYGKDSELNDEQKIVLSIFPYLLFASSIFLIATFIVYSILPRLRNVHGLTIMCYTASLTTMYIGLGINQLSPDLPLKSCMFLGSLNHFSFLSSFAWLNVMSFDIWLTLKNKQPRKSQYGRKAVGKRFLYFSLYACGLPLAIVSIGQILQAVHGYNSKVITPSFGKISCWFPINEKGPFWLYLYGPVGLLISINVVFFFMTLRIFYQASVDSAFASNHARTKQKFRVILSLFFLMGVSWTVEVISFAVGGSVYIWLAFDIFNILTGVFVFVIFVCKPNVWRQLKKKVPVLARLDPCCPSFMTRIGTQRTIRSSEMSVKQKLSSASSNASKYRKSLETSFTADEASRLQDVDMTVLNKADRNSSKSNREAKL